MAAPDEIIHQSMRLKIMAALNASGSGEWIEFTRLKTIVDATDGNLGAQLRKLEEASFIDVKKQFVDRKPVSWYSLTGAGRKALKAHLRAMELVIQSAKV